MLQLGKLYLIRISLAMALTEKLLPGADQKLLKETKLRHPASFHAVSFKIIFLLALALAAFF